MWKQRISSGWRSDISAREAQVILIFTRISSHKNVKNTTFTSMLSMKTLNMSMINTIYYIPKKAGIKFIAMKSVSQNIAKNMF